MTKPVRVLVVGTALSVGLGVAGGELGVYLGAPFYFGFFFGFVLTGLITMFWLAAVLSKPPAGGN